VVVEEVGHGTGEAWQQFAVGASTQAMMGGLDYPLGGEPLLCGSSSATEAEQAGDKSDRKSKLRVEEEMTEQANGVIVLTAALQEGKGGGEDGALRVGEVGLGNGGLGQPTGEVRNCCGHGIPCRIRRWG
jgi:hypothetical protein